VSDAARGNAIHSVIRNVPSLLNAALQPEQFADERAGSLEQQIGMVLSSANEMRSSAKIAAERVSANASYRAEFKRLWNERAGVRGATITDNALVIALAAYLRSLTAMNSRFDRAMRGEPSALTTEEKLGFNLFTGKARCATCHFAPVFNGAAPPAYASSEPEIINVPNANVTKHATIDRDLGRARIDGLPEHRYAFKVPTVRNVALTAPYMHNGVFSTLEQVVDFYNRGGGAGIGIASTSQTLSSTPLHLSTQEQSALVAFLRSLTDSTLVTQRSRSVTVR
jgi:cytochrome c peroxidase